MRSFVYPTAVILLLLGVSMWTPPPTTAATDGNAYFDALVARGDHWKSFSLRPRAGQPVGSPYYEHQLDHPKDGGYANANSGDLWVTYDPAHDADPNRQDAAKVVIPAFSEHHNSRIPDRPVADGDPADCCQQFATLKQSGAAD